ncbi:acid-activated urea channel [Enterococcus sp. DIV0724b]
MLGVGLLFVAITLISNGYCGLAGVDKKSTGLINLMTGSLSFMINTIYLFRGAYYDAGTGYLFAFTYLMVGLIYIFDLDDAYLWNICFFCGSKYDSSSLYILYSRW